MRVLSFFVNLNFFQNSFLKGIMDTFFQKKKKGKVYPRIIHKEGERELNEERKQ